MDKEFVDAIFLLNEDTTLSQRKLAAKLNMSLGKVNGIINTLISNGYIEKASLKGKGKYVVTDNGMILLGEEIKDKKNTRIDLHDVDYNKPITEAVILAAGQCEDFDFPVGLVEIDGEALIDKTIETLKENGIYKITIVAGYKSELYIKHFKERKNINVVINKEFNGTGSMKSLDKAKDFVKGDFILLESDVIFERYALEKLIESSSNDCVILSNVSGFGDEVFVEIKDGYIFKMSKDIHAFNRIDGELLGVVKISKKMYDLMVHEYKGNLNPYTNYEYILLDVAITYKLGYVKFDNLLCGEIDTLEQLRQVRNFLIPQMKIKELTRNRILKEN